MSLLDCSVEADQKSPPPTYGGAGAVDKKAKAGLTPVMAQNFVSHCQAEMLLIEEYGESTGISGNIDALAVDIDVEIIES